MSYKVKSMQVFSIRVQRMVGILNEEQYRPSRAGIPFLGSPSLSEMLEDKSYICLVLLNGQCRAFH